MRRRMGFGQDEYDESSAPDAGTDAGVPECEVGDVWSEDAGQCIALPIVTPEGTVPEGEIQCDPGYEWFSEEQQCLPVPVTGPEASITPGAGPEVPYTPPAAAKKTVVVAKTTTTPTTTARSVKLADLLTSKSGLWVAGGVLAAVGLLALLAKPRRRR
jgi:hypothetical protein